MEKIIPRWEWRTFGETLSEGVNSIQKYPMVKQRESSEIYILSEKSNDNTKIRDRLMDIKTLLRVDENGLEQWIPILKASFPIHITELAVVFKAYNLAFPNFQRNEYTYEEYLQELISPTEGLHTVNVFKKRNGYVIDGCIVEIAEVKFNGKPQKTIAVEQEDPELVMQTVRKLGLDMYENINYIKAMKKSIGLQY